MGTIMSLSIVFSTSLVEQTNNINCSHKHFIKIVFFFASVILDSKFIRFLLLHLKCKLNQNTLFLKLYLLLMLRNTLPLKAMLIFFNVKLKLSKHEITHIDYLKEDLPALYMTVYCIVFFSIRFFLINFYCNILLNKQNQTNIK